MSSSCLLPNNDLILSLKSHKCSLCEKCLVCHQCLLARGYLRGGSKPIVTTAPDTEDQINAILDAILKNQSEDEQPRYILVGPNNEIVEGAPKIKNVRPRYKQLIDVTLNDDIDDLDCDDPENVHLPKIKKTVLTFGQKTFPSEQDLNAPHSEEVHECKICNMTFQFSNELRNHSLGCTFETPPVFKCGACEKTFKSKRDFNVHQIYHAVEEVHECKICHVTFKYSYELIKHSLYHDSLKSFPCEYCKRSYPTEDALTIHMRVHTGAKPFVCDVCDRAFKENFTLKKHLMIHTNERPFACDVCGRSFRDKLKLERHNWIHEGIKPFSCIICEKAFRHKCNLKSHLFKHHNMATNNMVVDSEVEI